jgi:cellulose synthase/poly-beta-1,6-N-acetylglucosamine synthase-like glycosyltransferase
MPTPTPSASVIVPVYNGADTIAACLESLVNQAYPSDAYEIIVVENGSTDETTQIVQAEAGPYPVRLLHSAQRGPAAARNLGLATSEADIVAFTDADCTPAADWLAELVKPYADPEIGGVGGQILACDHAGRTMVEMFLEQHPPLVNFVSGEHEFLPHLYTANGSYRRSLLEEIGGFNPRLITAQDVDVAWRVQLQTGARLCYAPRAIVYHRHRATRAGLARQYRRYGFGEILLDTLYHQHPGYPRNRRYQVRRILSQIAALPRYALSAILQQVRAAAGRTTPYQAAAPGLWFLIESSNVRGKLEALIATRFMRDAQPALNIDAQALIGRFFPSHKD